MSKIKLFNARTQKVEDAEATVDADNEIVCTFADGGFVKFPAGLTQEEFDKAIALHEEHNTGQEIITPETEAARLAERNNSLALIGEKPETVAEETPTDSPSEPVNIEVKTEDSNAASDSPTV